MNPKGVKIFEFIPEQNIFIKFIKVIFVNEKYGKELYINLVDDIYGNLLSKTEYKYEFLYGNEWLPRSYEEFKLLARGELEIDFICS